jgi:hypothetical protein
MSAKLPFEEFRVAVSGEHHVCFVVAVLPTHWRYSEVGDDSVERQRKFIHDAIREKIEREQQGE